MVIQQLSDVDPPLSSNASPLSSIPSHPSSNVHPPYTVSLPPNRLYRLPPIFIPPAATTTITTPQKTPLDVKARTPSRSPKTHTSPRDRCASEGLGASSRLAHVHHSLRVWCVRASAITYSLIVTVSERPDHERRCIGGFTVLYVVSSGRRALGHGVRVRRCVVSYRAVSRIYTSTQPRGLVNVNKLKNH